MAGLLKTSLHIHLRPVFQLLAGRTLCTAVGKTASTSSSQPDDHYDIIIGGGGLVGTTLAAALAKQKILSNKRILLLEGAPPFKGFDPTAQYGNRVSAINNNTIDLFRSIGAWPHMEKARVKPVKQMQVWDACSDALIQFQHEHFSNDVACIVENDLMLDAVYRLLGDELVAPNVEVRNKARINWVQLPALTKSGLSEVGLETGEKYSCDLLIGADGANSLVRREMAVDVFAINYDRVGIVATLELDENADNCVAWQRFIPSGPIALLPLNDSMSSLVWSTTVMHSMQLMGMSHKEFVDSINEAFLREYQKNDSAVKAVGFVNRLMGYDTQKTRQYPPRVRNIVESSRATFPLGFLHASSYVGNGVALIGDAAHRIHPLAGQGVNLGFSDIRNLVSVLTDGAYAGAKLGDSQYLLKYEQRSLSKNVPIMIGVHGIQKLYSTELSPVVLLRSLGLQVAQNLPLMKNFFMKRAMS